MSFDSAFCYLREKGFDDRVHVFEDSSATVHLASERLGVPEAQIAKTICFKGKTGPVMVVSAGDTKVNGGDFKRQFGFKPSFMPPDETFQITGHRVGGICPFGLKEDIPVYIDESVKRFDYVFPACGDDRSAVKLTPEELFAVSNAIAFISVFHIIGQDNSES